MKNKIKLNIIGLKQVLLIKSEFQDLSLNSVQFLNLLNQVLILVFSTVEQVKKLNPRVKLTDL